MATKKKAGGKKKSTWSARQNTRASEEQGWAIFECGNSPGSPDYSADTDPRIQRDNDRGVFKWDDDAWRFVWFSAQPPEGEDKPGNKLAAEALEHIRIENPMHYKEIADHAAAIEAGDDDEEHATVTIIHDPNAPPPKVINIADQDCSVNPCELCRKREAFARAGKCYDCEHKLPHEWADGVGCKVTEDDDER